MNGIWTQSCLDAARPIEGVPPQEEIMDTVQWRLSRCAAEGHADDEGCSNLLGAVQSHCHGA